MSNNLVIRTATPADLKACMELSKHVGTGMTSMPTDESRWMERLTRSEHDFNAEVPALNNDEYFMVLEDLDTGAIVGSGALYAGIGVSVPFYSYKLTTLVFLSRARMLLLADFPERFDEKVFAELRGWTDENGRSPFWEHLGRKFFDLSFKKADFISAVEGWQFISDLMPKHPVYLDLLPEAAQDVVGKPHDHGIGAMKILEREGFKFTGYIDIFDAGPCLEAQLDSISTVANSRLLKAQLTTSKEVAEAPSLILSNNTLTNYRMTLANGMVDEESVSLDEQTMQRLQVNVGELVRVVEA